MEYGDRTWVVMHLRSPGPKEVFKTEAEEARGFQHRAIDLAETACFHFVYVLPESVMIPWMVFLLCACL